MAKKASASKSKVKSKLPASTGAKTAKTSKPTVKPTVAKKSPAPAAKATPAQKEIKAPKVEKNLKSEKVPKSVDPVSSKKPELKSVKTAEPKVAEPEVSKKSDLKIKKEPKVKKTKAEVATEKQLTEDVQKWSDYKDKYGHDKAPSYSMSGVFEPKTCLQHKVLGWGYILSVQNDRLEVLFETGPKILISNYKPA